MSKNIRWERWVKVTALLVAGVALVAPAQSDELAQPLPLTNDVPYQQNPVYLGLNVPMKPDRPFGDTLGDEHYRVSPQLPAGLSLDAQTGVISGTPTQLAGVQNYLISRQKLGVAQSSNLALGVFPTTPRTLHPTQGFVGNTFAGNLAQGSHSENGSASSNNSVPNDVDAMYVAPDGTIYTNSYYDEGGNTASVFKNHHFLFALKDLHGWARLGGQAITADQHYIYAAVDQHGGITGEGYPAKACDTYYTVRRFTMNGIPAPFVRRGEPDYRSENGWDGSFLTISQDVQQIPLQESHVVAPCSAPIREGGVLGQQGARVTGLAAFQGKLYVSDFAQRKIRVFATTTMREYPELALSLHGSLSGDAVYPWQLAADSGHRLLWVIERPEGLHARGKVVSFHIGSSGRLSAASATITAVNDPSALAVNPSGRYLLLSDDGAQAQQVLIYELNHDGVPHLVRKIGLQGGAFGTHAVTKGKASPLTLNRPIGVGMDAQGTIYIASNGHGIDRLPLNGKGAESTSHGSLFTEISEYRFPRTLRRMQDTPIQKFKYFDGLFVDNLAVIGHTAFSKYFTFHIDPDHTESNLQLSVESYSLDPRTYPDDPRLTNERAGIWGQTLHGHTLLYMSTQIPVKGLAVYRIDAGVAVPAAYIYLSPEKHVWPDGIARSGLWTWTNTKGDGHIRASEIAQIDRPELHSLPWAWSTDERGTIWTAPESPDPLTHRFAIYALHLRTIDSHGVPRYEDVQDVVPDTTLGDDVFERIERLNYDAKHDIAYISGFTPDDARYRQHWGSLGTKLARYDHWSDPNRRVLRWSVNLPFALSLKRKFDSNAPATYPATISFAGQYIFIAFTAPRAIQVINSSTGHYVGQPVTPLERLGSVDSILDVAYGTTATLISGNRILLTSEEDNRGKNLYYIFHPLELGQ